MKKLERPIYIPFKVSDTENSQIQFLMGKLGRDRSDLIRYAIKKLYAEVAEA